MQRKQRECVGESRERARRLVGCQTLFVSRHNQAGSSSICAPAAVSASRAFFEKSTSRKRKPEGSGCPDSQPRIFTPSEADLKNPRLRSDSGVTSTAGSHCANWRRLTTAN